MTPNILEINMSFLWQIGIVPVLSTLSQLLIPEQPDQTNFLVQQW